MATTTSNDRHGLRSYLTGFVLAVILTLISFGLVAINALPRTPTLIVIAIAAVIQILVHLHYFLHLDLTAPRRNMVAIAVAGIVIFIMVGGTLWIMFDLYNRMMV